ncbi:hypothetical protein ES705_06598 [subsurface metagenome]
MASFVRDKQYYKFCSYGFLKNLRFFDPFIILFFLEMGFSFLQIGTLFAIREIATNILEIPTGVVADSYGRRKSMVMSFLSYILSFLIFFFFPSFFYYTLAMLMFALGEAFRTGTHKAMILEYLQVNNMQESKIEYYGHTRACSQLGSALSALIAAGIVFYAGSYRIVFLASVIPYIANLFLILTYPKELDGSIEREKTGNTLKDSMVQIVNTLRIFAAIFKNPSFLKILINSSSFDSVFKTVKDYIQPILQSLALSLPVLLLLADNRRVALITGIVYSLLYLLTSFASGRAGLVRRIIPSLPRAINLTFILGALFIIATGVLLFSGFTVISVVLFILFYMLHNLRRPLSIGYISELISNRVMATGLSGESQLKTILVALLAPVMGSIADALGIGPALLIMGFLLLILFPLLKIKSRED